MGFARFIQSECRIETFEVPVQIGAELSGKSTTNEAFVLLSPQYIPCSLLWFTRYLQIKHPTVLLPHDHTNNLTAAVIRVMGGCEVIYLNRKSAFDKEQLFSRLQGMYPTMTQSQMDSRFRPQHARMRAALSALLHFVATAKSNISDVTETGPFRVLYLEPEVSEVLQITRTEQHPCAYQGVGRSKDGFCLFSFVNHTQSPLGRSLLRQWFSLPSNDMEEIQRRRSVVRYFTDPSRRDLLLHLRRVIRRVKPTGRLFTLMRRGKMTIKKYQMLFRTICAFLSLYEMIAPVGHELPFLFEVLHSFDMAEISRMAHLLEGVIDGVGGHKVSLAEGGKTEGDTHISVHMDSDTTGLLRELHGRMHHLGSSLGAYANEAFQALSPALRSSLYIQCLYLPPYGYLMCVGGEQLLFTCQLEMDQHAPDEFPAAMGDAVIVDQAPKRPPGVLDYMQNHYGWTLHHEENNTYFFKSAAMLELDAVVGDLRERICRREDEIRKEMEESLLYRSLYLLPPSRVVAELDCLLSFAYGALQHNWSCPTFVPRAGYLSITDGWHPLLEVSTGALTPFSFTVDDNVSRVNIITGPNQSGKSVLLGAIAHIVFLSHLGSYVPAMSVELGLFGGIFSTVSTAAKIGASNSSFTEELSSLNRILHLSEANTAARASVGMEYPDTEGNGAPPEEYPPLILLDEFGRGTTPEDGIALMGAVLRYFTGVLPEQKDSPERNEIVLLTTHFTEILDTALTEDDDKEEEELPFPFELLQYYVMQCSPVYADHTLSLHAPMKEGLNRLPIDAVPTFTPFRVTGERGRHRECIAQFRQKEKHLLLGPALGRQCGLPDELVSMWEEYLLIMTEKDAAE
ncbi:DNA mismatch repair protein MSH5 [Angomonas deanei]|uniref:MutS domain III/MutS domain V, putative n=1 Tax=Angomonas deanei TaxID=59799 RepID=A0A7G2CGC0_9TRYP|nr:DNA mismatch repair protein MSH5 [Angomonas deanei]CAD2218559.1 MutS domain III/MutS domain V, putative [Angomonas deanei]|eukprot:EPY35357.1 DNA mismatch repair protein MSH5 [Angomonas deanei]